MVDTADGLRTVEDVTVTTTATGGGFKNTGGGNGLAVVGGLDDSWFDSREAIKLTFAIEAVDGTVLTNLQMEIIDVGARAVDSDTITLSNQDVSLTASFPAKSGAGTSGILSENSKFGSDEVLTVQTGPVASEKQRTQLIYVTFKISDESANRINSDGDLLSD